MPAPTHALPTRTAPAPATLPLPAPGQLTVAALGDFHTEAGAVIANLEIAFETWGELAPDRSNAVLILHALTGDSHVSGDPARPGWWEGMVGPGAPIDTDRFCVIAPNVLGGCAGSTGPATLAPDGRAWGSRFPRVTVRDMVRAEAALADALGIDRFAVLIGPSAGGHRALEWACEYPERVGQLVLIATSARTSADQLAWASMQLHALRLDPHYHGGDYYDRGVEPTAGLALARQIAHATYRCAGELNARFGRDPQPGEDPYTGGRFAIQSYLDYHGDKLTNRFDAGTYRVLTEAMLTHDVGRGRGGTRAALGRITAPTLSLGVDSDRLFPAPECRELALQIPRAQFGLIASAAGHDGFLIERDQVGAQLASFLTLPAHNNCC